MPTRTVTNLRQITFVKSQIRCPSVRGHARRGASRRLRPPRVAHPADRFRSELLLLLLLQEGNLLSVLLRGGVHARGRALALRLGHRLPPDLDRIQVPLLRFVNQLLPSPATSSVHDGKMVRW